jgi:hypothetical protein
MGTIINIGSSEVNKGKSNLMIAQSQEEFIKKGNEILQTVPRMSMLEQDQQLAGVSRPQRASADPAWSLGQ